MTSQEMMKTQCKAGHIFANVARLGDRPDWQQIPRPIDFDSAGDPNSPIYGNKLFGYDEAEFLRRQYK